MTDSVTPASDALEEVRAAQQRGDVIQAFDLATSALEGNPEPSERDLLRYQAVLALAQSGATRAAQALYDGWKLGEANSEDAAALAGRLAKDRALAATESERAEAAGRAAELYLAAYETWRGYFPAINAATLSLLAGDASRAEALAREVVSLLDASPPSDEEVYYHAATRAEAELILGRDDEAGRAIERAAQSAGRNALGVSRTRRQLRLLCRARGRDAALLEPLQPPAVLAYCGHMIAAPGAAGRFPAEQEREVARAIRSMLDRHSVGIGYGALACGADILFAEALLERGAELHVVLPFDREAFLETSVRRGGPGWVERFERCLSEARNVSLASEDGYLGDDSLFDFGNRVAMGLAVLHAQVLDTEARQIAVWDGQPDGGPGGTGGSIRYWESLGFPSDTIEVAPSRQVARTRDIPAPKASAPHRELRSLIFADVRGFTAIPEARLPVFLTTVMQGLAEVIDGFGADVLYRNTWGDAMYLVLRGVRGAAECALALQEFVQSTDFTPQGLPHDFSMRLGAHFAPVYETYDPVLKGRNYHGAQVSRTARIEPITPPGEIYVTEPFAATLALEGGNEFRCDYVGRVPLAKKYGSFRMYRLSRALTGP
jgi:class 3 adenylate cyclase